MTASSPVQLATSPPYFDIRANGSLLATSMEVASIDTWSGVNKLPKARLVVSDGGAADQGFPISSGAALAPGATLDISIGYGSDRDVIFSGIIYRHGLEVSVDGPSRLIVEATDKAMVMTLARRNAIFQQVSDSQLCEKLLSQAGLAATVAATSTVHESIVQYYSTDWDLLVIRAQAAGMVVVVDAGAVSVAAPKTDASPVLTLSYGESLLDFRAEIDAATQLPAAAIQSVAWDPATQALAVSGNASTAVTTPGDLSPATLAEVFGLDAYVQQTAGACQVAELSDWSSALLMRTQLAKIRGEARFQGSALAKPGCMVALAGLGDRFDGAAYVSGVHHRVAEGLWRTAVEIGLSPQAFAAVSQGVAAPGAAGQMPAMQGLQVGTVKQIDQDAGGEFRILLTLPLLQASGGEGVWARFGAYYASNGVGSCFYPEIGDEVVVAFLSGDPRYPVVLGSLYSSKNPPPQTPQSPNTIKTLMTRSKLHLDFNDDTKEIALVTPAAQSVKINDTDKSIVLTDANGNTVTMNSSGVTIKSAADLTLTAQGSVTISAQNAFSAAGEASAKLTSSGSVQVKGLTVALNP